MSYRVDLRTPILLPDHRVFMARPGENSRHFSEFEEARAVGPIIPGLRLNRHIPIAEQEGLEYALYLAHHMKSTPRNDLEALFGEVQGQAPTLHATDDAHRRERFGPPAMRRQTRDQYLAILRGYFQRAKRGDLVVIPTKSYLDRSILAEFSGEPADVVYVELNYKGVQFEIPARPFRELCPILGDGVIRRRREFWFRRSAYRL